MDQFQQRMLRNLRGRHVARIRQDAAGIRAAADDMLRGLDEGRVPDHRATEILARAQEITVRLAALEAVKETADIYEAAAEGQAPDGP